MKKKIERRKMARLQKKMDWEKGAFNWIQFGHIIVGFQKSMEVGWIKKRCTKLFGYTALANSKCKKP